MSTICVYDIGNNVNNLATLKSKSKPGGLKKKIKKNKYLFLVWLSEAKSKQWCFKHTSATLKVCLFLATPTPYWVMSASQLGIVGTLESTPQLVWLESSSEAFTPIIFVMSMGHASPSVNVLLIGLFVLRLYCMNSGQECQANML